VATPERPGLARPIGPVSPEVRGLNARASPVDTFEVSHAPSIEQPDGTAARAELGVLDRVIELSRGLSARNALIGIGFAIVVAGSLVDIAQFVESRGGGGTTAAAAIASVDGAGDGVSSEPATTTTAGASDGRPATVGSPSAGPAGDSTVSSGTGAGQDTPGTYTVVKGDMLYAIALRYGTTPQVLATLNELADPNVIEVGQVLLLPSAGPS
jgi:hypothetical protein